MAQLLKSVLKFQILTHLQMKAQTQLCLLCQKLMVKHCMKLICWTLPIYVPLDNQYLVAYTP